MDVPKLHALAALKKTLGGTGNILEVGFGDSTFLESLYNAGYSVTGTEVSEWMVQEARLRLPNGMVVCTDDPSEVEGEFDAVCCFEVLEHLTDPLAFASKLPGKTLYGSVPDPWRWYPKLTGRYEYWDYPPNHLWRYCLCSQLQHEPGCTLNDRIEDSDGLKVMSLKGLLSEAGYDQITVYQTHVQPVDILRIIPIRRNAAIYDQMRTSGRFRLITSTGKKLLIPGTYLMSSILNLTGFHGVSYYFTAIRS